MRSIAWIIVIIIGILLFWWFTCGSHSKEGLSEGNCYEISCNTPNDSNGLPECKSGYHVSGQCDVKPCIEGKSKVWSGCKCCE